MCNQYVIIDAKILCCLSGRFENQMTFDEVTKVSHGGLRRIYASLTVFNRLFLYFFRCHFPQNKIDLHWLTHLYKALFGGGNLLWRTSANLWIYFDLILCDMRYNTFPVGINILVVKIKRLPPGRHLDCDPCRHIYCYECYENWCTATELPPSKEICMYIITCYFKFYLLQIKETSRWVTFRHLLTNHKGLLLYYSAFIAVQRHVMMITFKSRDISYSASLKKIMTMARQLCVAQLQAWVRTLVVLFTWGCEG